MDIVPTCYSAAGVDAKQREVFASPLVIRVKGDKSDRNKSEKPLKTQTKKRIFPARPTCYLKFAKSIHYTGV